MGLCAALIFIKILEIPSPVLGESLAQPIGWAESALAVLHRIRSLWLIRHEYNIARGLTTVLGVRRSSIPITVVV